MRSTWLLVSLMAWCAGAFPASAGAYTPPEGEVKVFVSGLVNSGDRYYDGRGRLKSRDKLKKWNLQLFGEYGLTDRLTLFGATTLERITLSGDDRSRRSGLGRSEIGGRVKLLDVDRWIVSAQSSVVIAGAKQSDRLVVAGETDDQFDVRGLVARSFEVFDRPAFVDVAAGYRARTGDPADELRLDASFGVRPWARVLLVVQSFNSFGRERWAGPFPLKQRIHKLQGGVLYDLTDAVQLYAAAFATPEARDALDERGIILGVGYRF